MAQRSTDFFPASSRPTVISVGIDVATLRRRNRVLSEAGFAIRTATSLEDGLAEIDRGGADVLIIGHAFPPDARQQIAKAVRQHEPQASIIMLYYDSIAGTELADAILSVFGDPDDLVQTIRYLLRKREITGR